VDGGHDPHLEQRFDHFAALHGELLRKIGHQDALADLDLASHRRGRPRETVLACALARLFLDRATTALARGAAALGHALREVQLALRETPATFILVVTDMRPRRLVGAVLVGVAARCVGAAAMMRARRAFGFDFGRRDRLGFGLGTLTGLFFLALLALALFLVPTLGFFFLTLAIGLAQRGLFGFQL